MSTKKAYVWFDEESGIKEKVWYRTWAMKGNKGSYSQKPISFSTDETSRFTHRSPRCGSAFYGGYNKSVVERIVSDNRRIWPMQLFVA